MGPGMAWGAPPLEISCCRIGCFILWAPAPETSSQLALLVLAIAGPTTTTTITTTLVPDGVFSHGPRRCVSRGKITNLRARRSVIFPTSGP